eukprot:TRINITY_DN146_c0_g1_i1.p1 TRINITY_DN146_c0_g1~~TRINITY_DN146_c0_g1_i1.p1  ORF type:complete len:376 (-),score=75.80 TRINITY_DN146_c0_g1_i1:41-1102(-)
MSIKPIVLTPKARTITHLTYNYDGDLLFTAGKEKDAGATVWWADNGERIGTYGGNGTGHNGSIWYLDVTRDSKYLLTASADNLVKLWNVQTGKELFSYTHKVSVRCVNWALGDKLFLTTTDAIMNNKSAMYVYQRTNPDNKNVHAMKEIISAEQVKINKALWGPLNERIYTCNDDGTIRVYDPETGKQTEKAQIHKKDKPIFRIKFDKYQANFLTASKDGTAKLVDTRSLEVLKTYQTGRPVNAADISPIKDHVLVGGGEAAEFVTQTRTDTTQFKMRFFHKIFEYELGSVVGHFGPVNALSFSPDGKSFASGSEDGFVRIHHFDKSYLDAKETPEFHDPPPKSSKKQPKLSD